MKLDLLHGSLQIAMVFSAVKFRYELIDSDGIHLLLCTRPACMYDNAVCFISETHHNKYISYDGIEKH